MRKFLTLVAFLLFSQCAQAEKLPVELGDGDLPYEKYPIIHTYVKNYADALYKNFNPRKHWPRHSWFITSYYTAKKDGSTLERFWVASNAGVENKKLGKLEENFLKQNPPPPFPEGLDEEQIKFEVYLFSVPYKPKVEYYPKRKPSDIETFPFSEAKKYIFYATKSKTVTININKYYLEK